MKSLLLVTALAVVAVSNAAGQIHCYSCSSNPVSNSYHSKNINCLRNVTAVRTVRCPSGYYCLTTYYVEDGTVTNLRRSCQNPRSDHNQNTDEAPIEDACTSSHTQSGYPDSTTCYSHCTTDRCNNATPGLSSVANTFTEQNYVSIVKCPKECPATCNASGACVAPLSCVQCTTDSDKNCETKTEATPCPGPSYDYCAATRTEAILNLEQGVARTAVTKSCTTFRNAFSIPFKPCNFRTRSKSNNNKEIRGYTCVSFCTTDGCNVKVPGGKLPTTDVAPLYCVVCSQAGHYGRCSSNVRTTRCPASTTHCKSTVIYYTSPVPNLYGEAYTYQVASVIRECATEAVTAGCTTANVAGTNLQHVSCQETCTSNGCNSGWPTRPKCTQCEVTNGTHPVEQFERCRVGAPEPYACHSPAARYCTIISNNTASNQLYPRTVKRGCSVDALEEECFDIPESDGTIINHCQKSCNTSGCNQRTSV